MSNEVLYDEAPTGWTRFKIYLQIEEDKTRVHLYTGTNFDDVMHKFFSLKKDFIEQVFLVRMVHCQQDSIDGMKWTHIWPKDPTGEWRYLNET